MRTYIAGPMRGLIAFNFPAFDDARDRAKAIGLEPISPADLDRASGFDETSHTEVDITPDMMREWARRDLDALQTCDAIALLPGWERSTGATAELAVAKWLGLKVLDARTFEPLDPNILREAERITRGDRNDDYGSPAVEHQAISDLWSVIIGQRVTALQVADCMILLKIARNQHRRKRDNYTDIAGYADCAWRIIEETGVKK